MFSKQSANRVHSRSCRWFWHQSKARRWLSIGSQ